MPGFIIDLDGTMYAGTDPIPEADRFIREIRGQGWPFLYLTNNSSAAPEHVAAKLQSITGIETDASQVLTSAMAAARYITEDRRGRRVFCVGESGLRQALEEAGFVLTDDSPDYVVQGIDRDFTYAKLEQAVRHIRSGARFIQTNPDHLLPMEGRLIPGAGSIAAAIKTASEAEAVLIGKPSSIIMRYAIERIGLPAGDIWVIGDNIRTDIGGGIAAGCRTALSLTGLATPDNCEALIASTGIRPDITCVSLMELFRLLKDAEA
ncbi:TIGR01457 family HAD-type hydrolase [Gorillibacterium sp. sgz5001074]|uniref:TIGR01457 family HAD-type hydrolase n=1 Tax=Gorillibacterium sp. sgz5001074 TaxID=3446695 RepID=UPI003F666433